MIMFDIIKNFQEFTKLTIKGLVHFTIICITIQLRLDWLIEDQLKVESERPSSQN